VNKGQTAYTVQAVKINLGKTLDDNKQGVGGGCGVLVHCEQTGNTAGEDLPQALCAQARHGVH